MVDERDFHWLGAIPGNIIAGTTVEETWPMANRVETVATRPADQHPPLVDDHSFARIFGALRKSPYYRTYWFGNQASLLVMQMQFVAMGYLAFTLTNSAAILGLVNLASGVPMLLLSPVGGVIADRYPKRRVILINQLVLCGVALILGILIVLGLIQWWHLMVASFVQGCCFAVNMPTRQSWIPSLISEGELPNAIALNNAGLNASRIIGPALGGVLIAIPAIGARGVFFLSLPAVAWVFYSLLKIPILGEPVPGKRPGFWPEFSFGLRYIFGHETLRPLFTMALVVLLLGMSYQMLLPAYALGVFHVGSEGLGLMGAVYGTGALVGSLLMAYMSRSPNRGRIQAVAGVSLGVGLFAYGVAAGFNAFVVALVLLFGVGMATDFYSTINNTLILMNTDRALFGRVMSVYMMTWSLAPLAAAPLGTAVDHLGGPLTMMIIGGTLAAFVAGMVRFHPGFRQLT
jgi:MFS family permease